MNLTAALAAEGWMSDAELAWLAEQAQTARVIVEVGCWKGRSTLALVDNTPGRVYAVDTWDGGTEPTLVEELRGGGPDSAYRAFLAQMGARFSEGRVIPFRMDSAAAARLFDPASVDLVFIDASHVYADVLRDIAAYRPLVRPGGILSGHDYAIAVHPGVTQAVDELFPRAQRAGSIWWVQV